jgi:hypothetical protein
MADVDRCVVCGEPVPEGVQVCVRCRVCQCKGCERRTATCKYDNTCDGYDKWISGYRAQKAADDKQRGVEMAICGEKMSLNRYRDKINRKRRSR